LSAKIKYLMNTYQAILMLQLKCMIAFYL
jgi:hypothetical protein